MPIVEDFQKVAPLVERERCQPPVVQDQEFDARQYLEEAAVASITAFALRTRHVASAKSSSPMTRRSSCSVR